MTLEEGIVCIPWVYIALTHRHTDRYSGIICVPGVYNALRQSSQNTDKFNGSREGVICSYTQY